MALSAQKLSFLKALIAAAWADGELTHDEINHLKDFFAHFDPKGRDWAKVKMYLEDPLSPEEQEKVITEFVRGLGSEKERKAFLKDLEGV